jgi:hypothetical protein
MNNDRLILLADKLEGCGVYAADGPVPPAKFLLREWFRWSVFGDNIDPAACGFAGCAVGWACTDPRFQAMGLKVDRERHKVAPRYGDALGHHAVMRFFALDPDTADYLFAEDRYPWMEDGPLEVARRIRQVVAHQGVPQ